MVFVSAVVLWVDCLFFVPLFVLASRAQPSLSSVISSFDVDDSGTLDEREFMKLVK